MEGKKFFHKQKQVIHLKIYKMKFVRSFILCFNKRKSPKKCFITYLNKYKMDNNFINSENSKTSELNRPWLNLQYKIDVKRSDEYIVLSNLSIYYR